MIKSAKSALANHFGWDIAEMKDYEYQAGLYTKQVFSVGADDYYCASTDPKKLPKPVSKNRGSDFNWVEVPDNFVNKYGWKIFKHVKIENAVE